MNRNGQDIRPIARAAVADEAVQRTEEFDERGVELDRPHRIGTGAVNEPSQSGGQLVGWF